MAIWNAKKPQQPKTVAELEKLEEDLYAKVATTRGTEANRILNALVECSTELANRYHQEEQGKQMRAEILRRLA